MTLLQGAGGDIASWNWELGWTWKLVCGIGISLAPLYERMGKHVSRLAEYRIRVYVMYNQ